MGQHASKHPGAPFAYTMDMQARVDGTNNNHPSASAPSGHRNHQLRLDLEHDTASMGAEHPPYTGHASETSTQDGYMGEWAQVTVSRMPRGSGSGKITSTTTSMDLSDRSVIRLGPSIGTLQHLVKLDISSNQITALPDEFGSLVHLRLLNASHNHLAQLPESMAHLGRLKALNVSHNVLQTLPERWPRSLVVLIAHHNALAVLPARLAHTSLVSLHLDHNPPLASIPAEVADMPSMRKLLAQACGFPAEAAYPLERGPPSLKEMCARVMAGSKDIERTGGSRRRRHLAPHLMRYMAGAKVCSACNGPYFERCVRRGRMVERSGTNDPILVEYRLCAPHWDTEDERLLAMFATNGHCSSSVHDKDAVDAFAAEWMRRYRRETADVASARYTDADADGFYYCRLVPSHHESIVDVIQDQATPISPSLMMDTVVVSSKTAANKIGSSSSSSSSSIHDTSVAAPSSPHCLSAVRYF